MTESDRLKLTGIGGLYLFWLATWLVLGDTIFGPQNYNWSQALLAGIAGLTALRVSRRVAKPYRGFLLIIGVGLGLLALSWLTYDPDLSRPILHFSGAGAPSFSDVGQAAFVFMWLCAWGYLAVSEWHSNPPSTLTGAVLAVLLVGLATILANFYFPQYGSVLATVDGRLSAVIAGIEYLVLTLGLNCILLGQPHVITWLLFATALLVAGDIVYSAQEVPGAIQAIWMFGECLMLASLMVMPNCVEMTQPETQRRGIGKHAVRCRRSGLSGLLVLISLGAVLLSVAVWLALVAPVWKHFFSVLFVVVLVAILVWITDYFDGAVGYLSEFSTQLLRQQLETNDWRTAGPAIRTLLNATGLGAYLDTLVESAARLKQDVLFLGPERLYPPPLSPDRQGEIRCFLVMPFSQDWSADVHRILAGACKAAGVQPARGDDLFTPTDFLDDIWQAINKAHFVIADITGRNPNVLYELGISHALAKPVLLLSRDAKDIPIDLSTRRVLLYGTEEGDWQPLLEHRAAKAISDILSSYALQPSTVGSLPPTAGD